MENYEFQDAFGGLKIVSEGDLREMAAKGEIQPDTLVRRAGGMNWAKARVVQGLVFAAETAHLPASTGPVRPVTSATHGSSAADPKAERLVAHWRRLAICSSAFRWITGLAGVVLLGLGLIHGADLGFRNTGVDLSLPPWLRPGMLVSALPAGEMSELVVIVVECGIGATVLLVSLALRFIQLSAESKVASHR